MCIYNITSMSVSSCKMAQSIQGNGNGCLSKDLPHSDDSEAVLDELARQAATIKNIDSPDAGIAADGSYFNDKPRRTSILSKRSGRPRVRVKKSVSFCSMPEDRRVTNGEWPGKKSEVVLVYFSNLITNPKHLSLDKLL